MHKGRLQRPGEKLHSFPKEQRQSTDRRMEQTARPREGRLRQLRISRSQDFGAKQQFLQSDKEAGISREGKLPREGHFITTGRTLCNKVYT